MIPTYWVDKSTRGVVAELKGVADSEVEGDLEQRDGEQTEDSLHTNNKHWGQVILRELFKQEQKY